MKINIEIFPFREIKSSYVGYIEAEKFDAKECFDLCNWVCWTEEKPKELHSNISIAQHGICFTNPETNQKWLAKSIDWLVGDNDMIRDYVAENKDKLVWL